MKAALYCRDLAGANGMTRSTLEAARALVRLGHEVDILVETADPARRLRRLFGPPGRRVRLVRVGPPSGASGRRLIALTARYDLFVNQLPGVYLPSLAARSWLWLHALPASPPRHLDGYRLLANSRYTRELVARRWGRRAEVLYPAVSVEDFPPRGKRPRILAVGTLGAAARPKNEVKLIRAFKALRASGRMAGWSLDLAGELEGGSAWLARLKAAASGAPVRIHLGAGLSRMRRLYGEASVYWHACRREHFGLAPLEAMAAGCVVLAADAGGPAETVSHGRCGWLYRDDAELRRLTLAVVEGRAPAARLRDAARARSRRYARPRFDARLRRLLKR